MSSLRCIILPLKTFVFLFVLLQCQSSWSGNNSISDIDIFQQAELFHGHTCTGLLIGLRLGLRAKEALHQAGAEGKMKAWFFNHSCAADGIQVAVDTTLGNRAIEIVDQHENRLILSDQNGTHIIEARLTKLADDKRKTFITLKEQLGNGVADSKNKQQIAMKLDDINAWFSTASDRDVVTITSIK